VKKIYTHIFSQELIYTENLFRFLFAVLGVNLLSGKFFQCVDVTQVPPVPLDPAVWRPPGVPLTRAWCEANGGVHNLTADPLPYFAARNISLPPNQIVVTEWRKLPTNFDDIGNALLSLYEVASLELWGDVMINGADAAPDYDTALSRDMNQYICIYFLFVVLSCSWFLLQMFVGE
jgi:hypothetical protein